MTHYNLILGASSNKTKGKEPLDNSQALLSY